MNVNRILCPIDFYENNSSLVKYAITIAKSSSAEIMFLHSFKSYEASGAKFDPEQVELEKQQEMRQLVEMIPASSDVRISHHVEFGSPSETILKFADEQNIDLIVIGTHGRTGLSRVLLGSVAESVIRHAECPVIALKIPFEVTQNS